MSRDVDVDMQKLVEHFRHDFQRVLISTLAEVAPSVKVEPYALFTIFQNEVRRKFNHSERLPSSVMN